MDQSPHHTTSTGNFGLAAGIVLGAGSIAGAFLSKALAEIPQVEWPFYRWESTIALSVLCGIVFVLGWRIRAGRSMPGLGTTAPIIPFYLLVVYLAHPIPNLLQAWVLLGGVLTLVFVLSTHPPRPQNDRWIAFLIFVIPLLSYLATLTPAVGTRDGYELQAISATMGFAHPTGYPLFPLLGRLWIAILQFGSIAWRINVLCALFAAASAPLVYGTVLRALPTTNSTEPSSRRPFAALSALLFAFSNTLWTQASQPEKYTLNAFFVALILYIAFGTTDPEAKSPHPHLRWLALAYGLSLTHHRTMLMLAPALATYVFWRDPTLLKRPKEWLSALGLALLPLLIYLYIPWRAAAQGWYMTVPEFLNYISGAYYGQAVHLMDWLRPERAAMFWRFAVAQYGYVGIGLGAIGLLGLGLRRRWRFLTCTVLAYVTYYFWGTVWYAYYNDVNSFIPNHMLFAFWIGSGAWTIWESYQATWHTRKGQTENESVQPRRAKVAQAILWSVLLLLPMWMIWTNAPQVDASEEWNLTRWGEIALSQDIAPQATILADREKHPPLDYFARVEQRRLDTDVVILGDEQAYLQRLAWDLAQEKPVYLARFLPGLEGSYHLRSLGPLVEVGTEPLLIQEKLQGTEVSFGDSIQLLGYKADEHSSLSQGESWYVTFFWKALSPVPGNYQIRLRLKSSMGQIWWTSSEHPVSGMYPTAAWKPGEIIPDWHEIPAAETLPPGKYTVEVGLFTPFAQQGLVLADGQPWFPVQELIVESDDASPEIGHPLRVIAPGQWQLLGYDMPQQTPPQGRATLTLYWRPVASLPDYEIGTRLSTSKQEGEWRWAVPGKGEYPTSQWTPKQTIITTHPLEMPAENGQASVQIAVRKVGSQDQRITFYPRWLAPKTTVLSLPPFTIAGHPPVAPGAVNYDDLILLLSANLETQTLPPGAPLELSVRWQCMQAMEEDYTLFIQLLAPDGMLKGQIDVWPQNGTHPTSQWREGEIIEDTYLLYVDAQAPPGSYQVQIGWYLLETMQRLRVLNDEGQAVDNKILIPGLTITE